MLPRILTTICISVIITTASYLVDLGCSCGPARGFPFSYVHPYEGCTTGRFVLGADAENRFGPVFDIESVAYDVLLWGTVGYCILRRYQQKSYQEETQSV